jgi:glycosyltransferase involved in cell wall biosynthesis
MKKVLVLSHAMYIGGAERALIGLLSSFDKSEYRVDLFLMKHDGELFDLIPEGVNLLPEIKEYTCLGEPIANTLKKGCFGVAFGRFIGKMRAKAYTKKHNLQNPVGVEVEYSHKYTKKYMQRISNTEYDLVISFLTPHYFAIEKCCGKKALAWIHTDYSFIDIDAESETKMWERYDGIVSISDSVGRAFATKFPTLEDKLVRIDNIYSPEAIRKSSLEGQNEIKNDKPVIVSVGRLHEQKNFVSVPIIASEMKKIGADFRWYILGSGTEEQKIRENIAKYGMEDTVILLGSRANPYPYIAACDVYAQPSLYEGKAIAVLEAQILGKPVVITDFATAKSQLKDGFDGIIVPLENRACAEGIAALLFDGELMMTLSENCMSTDYGNSSEVQKIYSFICED